jgi:uncharacterized SAM-binding protein YcdF (DUF218 family)
MTVKRAWRMIAAMAIAGWLLAGGFANLLIVSYPREQAAAIVVLSGSSRIAERNHFAAKLFRDGRAPRIILTNDNQQLGWDKKEERNPFSYEWARRILQADGVPADRIEVLAPPVTGTHEELQLVRDSIDSRQTRSLLLVTSAYHSRRTWWTAQRVFKDTGIELGLMTPAQTLSPWSWWLHRSGWTMVAGEYLKLGYYWVRF